MPKNPKTKNATRSFSSKASFFEGLKTRDPDAIRLLAHRLSTSLKYLKGIYLLTPEDMEEFRNDVILITLEKIETGSFQFQDHDPLTYAQAVARKLLANHLRKQNLPVVSLDGQDPASDFNPEAYLMKKEVEQLMGDLLRSLGEPCEKIIRLKYYDEKRDLEVIATKITAYTTVDSLKAKRSQCLKKLADLIRNKKAPFFSSTDLNEKHEPGN